jgi:hypothetical protein
MTELQIACCSGYSVRSVLVQSDVFLCVLESEHLPEASYAWMKKASWAGERNVVSGAVTHSWAKSDGKGRPGQTFEVGKFGRRE